MLLVASFPYPHSIQRPLMVAWFAFWVLEFGWLNAFTGDSDWRQNCRQLFPMAALGLYALVEILSLRWSLFPIETHQMIERHLAFLLVPLVGWVGLNRYYNPYWIWVCLIISSVFSLLVYTIGFGVYMHLDMSDIQQSIHMTAEQNWTNYWELIALKVKHRLLYSTTMLLAMVGLLATRKEMIMRLGKRKTVCYQLIAFCILLLAICISGSRQALLTLYLMLVFCLFRYLWHRRQGKVWFWIICVVGILMFGTVVSTNPRTSSIISLSAEQLSEQVRQNQIEPRIGIWYTCVRHSMEIPWKGVGAGCATKWLYYRFLEDGLMEHASINYHAHNQFFSLWIDLGLWMAILLTSVFLSYFLSVRREIRIIAWMFEIIILSVCCTDTLFDNVEGTFLVAIGMLCVMLENRKIHS